MSPSTSPHSSMNPGGSASAHAGMVSGEGGHLNTGRTLCTIWQGHKTHLWWTDRVQVQIHCKHLEWVLTHCKAWGPMGNNYFMDQFSPGTSGSTGTWQTGSSRQSGNSAATFGMPPVFLDSDFLAMGPSTGIHHCHSSRPSDGTDAAPTDVADPRITFIQDRTWTSTTTSATDTHSSAELYRPA